MDTFVEETASIDAEMKDTMDQVERLKDTLAKEQQRLAERKMWDAVGKDFLRRDNAAAKFRNF